MPTTAIGTPLRAVVTVFHEGVIRLEQLILPDRGGGEVDVAISTAAICGSDLHTVLGHRSTPAHTVLGHEGVGRIHAVDDHATDIRGVALHAGDKIVFAMLGMCGSCDRCRSGLSMKCRSLLKYGHASITTPPLATGALATHVRLLPTVPVIKIEDDTDDMITASAGCAVATAAAVVATASPTRGERVLIFGAGAVGFYCAAMFTTLGCQVEVREPSDHRLAAVREITGWSDAWGEQPCRVAVEASGKAAAFVDAVAAVDVGGHVIAAGSVSPGSSTLTFDPALVVTRRLSLTGVHNYSADDFRWGVDWLLAHGRRLGVDQLMSPPLPLSRIQDAFKLMADGAYARVVVQPPG